MEQELKDTLHTLVGMIEDLGKRIDNLERRIDSLENRMDHMVQDIKDIKAEQKEMNERLDTIASIYGSHEEAIRRLKARKIL